jgi:hypothetical protein
MKRRDVLTTTATIVFAGCIGGGGGDGGDNGSGTETAGTHTTAAETDAGGTVEPTTDAETDTPRTTAETKTTTAPTDTATATQPTSTATETAAGPTDTAIPVPDRLTDHRKDTPLAGEAQVTFKNGGSRIVVAGTIVGKNGCQKPVLDSVREMKSRLVITIATKRDAPTNTACSMALVELEYRFSVTVENPPKSVTVVHRGVGGKRMITTAKSSG